MEILVTGAAGFIGFHISSQLIKKGHKVVGVDNINNYYDTKIKRDRLKILKQISKKKKNFLFYKKDIVSYNSLSSIFSKNKIQYVIHLAAQAGVRYSITHPQKYVESNIVGFFNIIDLSRKYKIKHFLFASTSSVYGSNTNFPLKESLNTDKPLSFYAATKKSNEVIAYSYSNIFNLPCTALRFFTVYGPYGRPDMSLFKFTKSIIEEKEIELFNRGNHYRDFTYVDDVAYSVIKLIKNKPLNKIPFEIYNIGNSKPHYLIKFLELIEKNLFKKSKIKLIELQKGDVHKTHADINKLVRRIKFRPRTSVQKGINSFVKWYKEYFNI